MSSSHKSAAMAADDDDEWQSMPVESAEEKGPPYPSRPTPIHTTCPTATKRKMIQTQTTRAGFARSVSLLCTQPAQPHRQRPASQAFQRKVAVPHRPWQVGHQLHICTLAQHRHQRHRKAPRHRRRQGLRLALQTGEQDNADDDDDSDGEKGYTQLRLDEDEEAEQLHAATEYLFQDGSRHDPYGDNTSATPLNQMKTTKQLLSEGQKIAYVGLCSLIASEMVRQLRRVPGKNLDAAKQSIEAWKVKVVARLYQHMDIESSEQRMIESLAEHGVLATDLAPSSSRPKPSTIPTSTQKLSESCRRSRSSRRSNSVKPNNKRRHRNPLPPIRPRMRSHLQARLPSPLLHTATRMVSTKPSTTQTTATLALLCRRSRD